MLARPLNARYSPKALALSTTPNLPLYSQEALALMITGTAVANLFDGERDLGGARWPGVKNRMHKIKGAQIERV
jgi:hypothetical protein